jgi:membrane-bound lytic murein transglycosylase D
MIPAKVTLGHVARTVGISEAELQFLNPSLKLGVIPQVAGGFPLNLPVNYFATFEAKKETILNDPEIALQASGSEQYAQPTMVRVPRYVWYKVRRSDNIGGIAARYGVTISEIKKWNHLRSSTVARGQSLKILTFPEVPVYQNTTTAAKATPATKAESSSEVQTSSNAVSTATQEGKEEVLYYYEEGKDPKKVPAPASTNVATQQAYSTAVIKKPNVQYYRVQNGDTLWSIVQRYPGLSINKLRTDNRLTGRSTILKGQVLKIVL